MQSISSNFTPATDTTISDAVSAAETKKKTEAISALMAALKKRQNRHNTPFDGRIAKRKKEATRRKRKANKKRKLYVRYGKQT